MMKDEQNERFHICLVAELCCSKTMLITILCPQVNYIQLPNWYRTKNNLILNFTLAQILLHLALL